MVRHILFNYLFCQALQHVGSWVWTCICLSDEVQSLNHGTTREVSSGHTITSQRLFTSETGAPSGHMQVMDDMCRTRSLQTRSKKKRGRVIYYEAKQKSQIKILWTVRQSVCKQKQNMVEPTRKPCPGYPLSSSTMELMLNAGGCSGSFSQPGTHSCNFAHKTSLALPLQYHLVWVSRFPH